MSASVDWPLRKTRWCAPTAVLLLAVMLRGSVEAQSVGHTRTVALRATSSAGHVDHSLPLPPNLVVPEVLRPLIATMWRRSPSFRRQCARLAEQRDVMLEIELARGVQRDPARTRITRNERGRDAVAQVEWRQPGRYVEHIAHELEHVLEQMDGTDLRRLARQGVHGVVGAGSGEYETARAQAIGLAVAREVMNRDAPATKFPGVFAADGMRSHRDGGSRRQVGSESKCERRRTTDCRSTSASSEHQHGASAGDQRERTSGRVRLGTADGVAAALLP
jgi:hypothetical protein